MLLLGALLGFRFPSGWAENDAQSDVEFFQPQYLQYVLSIMGLMDIEHHHGESKLFSEFILNVTAQGIRAKREHIWSEFSFRHLRRFHELREFGTRTCMQKKMPV